uniref:Retrotransposon Copia-like N-terminal domain-containing protein n=1 Tax=Nicotiana tabacum TaxID=4097 RepID=A0A1S3ZR89_TOBAC|nr:PREDICTED: uncharacterized protein LOC107789468 [Nicotiana tabacum]
MARTAFSVHIKDLVPKVLHQTNYLKWVHLIQPVIEIYDLFGHIDGFESPPPEFNVSFDGTSKSVNSAFITWRKQDRLLLNGIQATIHSDLIPLLYHCSTVADVWTTLKITFYIHPQREKCSTSINYILLKGEIYAYMSKIQELADCLYSIGCSVNDSELVRCALNGLSLSYDFFVIMASHMRPAPRFSELWTMLLTHEARTLSSHNLVSPTTALVATVADPLSSASSGYRGHGYGRGRGRGGGRGRGRRRAQDYCRGNISQFQYSPSPFPVSHGGPFQHSTSGCGVLAPSPYHLPAFVAPTPTSTTMICQISDLSNHTTLACPQRHNHAYIAPSFQANMAALSLQSPPDKNWYLDFVATTHMTNDLRFGDGESFASLPH